MKKILIIYLVLLIPCVGDALTMCLRDNSLVVSLDKSISGTGNGYSAAEMLWWTEFSYGNIYGEATCLSEAEGGKTTGGMGAITNTKDTMIPQSISGGLSGQDANGNDRIYCWCRMTHPAKSRWVYSISYSASACATDCSYYCANRARFSSALRGGLFGSVGK